MKENKNKIKAIEAKALGAGVADGEGVIVVDSIESFMRQQNATPLTHLDKALGVDSAEPSGGTVAGIPVSELPLLNTEDSGGFYGDGEFEAAVLSDFNAEADKIDAQNKQ